MAMQIKVLYLDNTAGLVKAACLEELIRLGKIVAFKGEEGWVEVRRKRNAEDYHGPERRKSDQEMPSDLDVELLPS